VIGIKQLRTCTVPDLSTKWHLRLVVRLKPRPYFPQGKVPNSYCIRGWVGIRAGLDYV
jgi:hypothetical protein